MYFTKSQDALNFFVYPPGCAVIEAHLLKQSHWVDTQEVFSLHSIITYNQSLIWIKLGCKLVKTDIAGIAIALSGHSGSFRTSKDYC